MKQNEAQMKRKLKDTQTKNKIKLKYSQRSKKKITKPNETKKNIKKHDFLMLNKQNSIKFINQRFSTPGKYKNTENNHKFIHCALHLYNNMKIFARKIKQY